MTSTDAKALVNLAERMGIPTEDAVQRVVMRIVDEATRPMPPHATRSHRDTPTTGDAEEVSVRRASRRS